MYIIAIKKNNDTFSEINLYVHIIENSSYIMYRYVTRNTYIITIYGNM